MRDSRLLLFIAIGIGLAIGAISDVASHVQCGPPQPPSARVILVDNSLNHPIFVPERQWRPLLGDVPLDVVHIPGGDEIPPVEDYTHVIISGSTASLVDPPDWVTVEVDLVNEAADRGLAMLGSCFGHQMLVYALSGSHFVQTATESEVGWIEVEMSSEDWLFEEAPNPWHAFAWHYDEVVDPPAPWLVLGHSSACPVHVIRYGNAPIWGLQSHPETNPFTAKLLLLFDKVFYDWGSQQICAALLQRPRDDRIIGSLMEQFIEGEP